MSEIRLPIAYYQAPDKRLQATQDKLFKGLQHLFENDIMFEDISVSKLCQTAGIARQTFYRHYDSMALIIEINLSRVVNQFLQQVDAQGNHLPDSAPLTIKILRQNQTLIRMLEWAQLTETAIDYLVNDMARVDYIRDLTNWNQPFVDEMFARAVVSFAQVMTKHSDLTDDTLIQLYQLTVLNAFN